MQLHLSLTNFLLNGMHSVKDSLLMEEPQLRTQVLFPPLRFRVRPHTEYRHPGPEGLDRAHTRHAPGESSSRETHSDTDVAA